MKLNELPNKAILRCSDITVRLVHAIEFRCESNIVCHQNSYAIFVQKILMLINPLKLSNEKSVDNCHN